MKNVDYMTETKTKWLMYTVLVGLIPIFCRPVVWLISQNRTIELLNPADIVVFGLILHISNINKIEHLNDSAQWKTAHNGISVAFIVGYAVLLTAYLFGQSNPELVDIDVMRYVAGVLGIISFLLSFAIHSRTSKFNGTVQS